MGAIERERAAAKVGLRGPPDWVHGRGRGAWVGGRDRQKAIERWHLDRPVSEAPSATCVSALLQREFI